MASFKKACITYNYVVSDIGMEELVLSHTAIHIPSYTGQANRATMMATIKSGQATGSSRSKESDSESDETTNSESDRI